MQFTDSERVKMVLEHLKISANRLSKELKLPTPQVFYDIKAGKCGISKELAKKIQERYLNIDAGWLLTGVGSMTVQHAEAVTQEPDAKGDTSLGLVPVVDLALVGSTDLSVTNCEVGNIDISAESGYWMPCVNAHRGDLAISQYGDSMSPVIPAGSYLLIRRVDNWQDYLGYGNDFVLKLNDGRRIVKKILRYDEAPGQYFLARSYNSEVADERIPRSMIVGVWKIVSVVNNRGW